MEEIVTAADSETTAPILRQVILISAGASHSAALLCKGFFVIMFSSFTFVYFCFKWFVRGVLVEFSVELCGNQYWVLKLGVNYIFRGLIRLRCCCTELFGLRVSWFCLGNRHGRWITKCALWIFIFYFFVFLRIVSLRLLFSWFCLGNRHGRWITKRA